MWPWRFEMARLRMSTPEKRVQRVSGSLEYSHITQEEMRSIMKTAVDRIYTYLLLKESDKAAYDALLSFGENTQRRGMSLP